MHEVKAEGHSTIQTNSLQNLRVICVTEAIRVLCKKLFQNNNNNNKRFLKASLGTYVDRKMSALKVLPCQDPLACTELHTVDIISTVCNFSIDLP